MILETLPGLGRKADHRRKLWHDEAREPSQRSRAGDAIDEERALEPFDRADVAVELAQEPSLAAVEGEPLKVVDSAPSPLNASFAFLVEAAAKRAEGQQPCELDFREPLEPVCQRDADVALPQDLAAWHKGKESTAGAQHAGNLGKRRVNILDVLENHVGAHRVESVVGKRQAADLHREKVFAEPASGPQFIDTGVIVELEDVGPGHIEAPRPSAVHQLSGSATVIENFCTLPASGGDLGNDEAVVGTVGHTRFANAQRTGNPAQ